MKIYSFPSISNPDAKVLVLGTMPGVASLQLNQYYGHSRNAFWKLLFIIFEDPYTNDYEQRKQLVLKHNLALWDVLQACVREGSLDSAITEEVPNDFTSFLQTLPNLKLIVFNGQKAAKYFNKYVQVSNLYKQVTLPSTSPANARISFEQQLKEWAVIKVVISN
ncbi:DNA-deoxyinosine glycosylase [Flavobacterium orientale]|uniref:DNA-deoxyinosine glycosylase n=1 Tax=Flavobacterium orientale TaxID=1756020 RepID=A0A916Y7W3_9FLAO|nr:DNA-deoxyinosine glycosylase [Flavobacterium orientale]GGD34654.1 DNA-deoxyinosine glycosylase [Flavobacterium orientale]